jgi:hypothetical protein
MSLEGGGGEVGGYGISYVAKFRAEHMLCPSQLSLTFGLIISMTVIRTLTCNKRTLGEIYDAVSSIVRNSICSLSFDSDMLAMQKMKMQSVYKYLKKEGIYHPSYQYFTIGKQFILWLLKVAQGRFASSVESWGQRVFII